MLVFVWIGLRDRPHVVGGFHILFNGLMSIMLAPLIGAASIYFCVGGPPEIAGGGTHTGLPEGGGLFRRMQTPDVVVERRLLYAIKHCDLVITMGTGAARFFREHKVGSVVKAIPGAVPEAVCQCINPGGPIDVIAVGRLAPIKRPDILVESLAYVKKSLPNVSAVIVGDGPLRDSVEEQARLLGLDGAVRFVGHQVEVMPWLRESKVFVLTSDSEGLSLAMMEAMTCGLPVVVSDVGDLSDLVADGENGYLVPRRSPRAFADRIIRLLTEPVLRTAFSASARKAALRCATEETTRKWDDLMACCKQRAGRAC
jgi:glycosyltransferase involved in cell wall biosynthesis